MPFSGFDIVQRNRGVLIFEVVRKGNPVAVPGQLTLKLLSPP